MVLALNQTDKHNLKLTAAKARLLEIEGLYRAGSGHPGGSLSCTDILTYLYFYKMKVDPKNPNDPDRDRFVLSKGHAAPALYSVLALRGFFPEEDVLSLRKFGARLQGHPDRHTTPGVDISTGSLGQGFSVSCGMAAAAKLSKDKYHVYCVCGDGEIQEGQVWEAAEFASHHKLDTLTLFVDANRLQIDGRVADVMGVEPIDRRFEAFGWHVRRINGHDFEEIDAAVTEALEIKGQPCCIVCDTYKGKGVSFMEDNGAWHGVAPKKDDYDKAVAELSSAIAALEGGND